MSNVDTRDIIQPSRIIIKTVAMLKTEITMLADHHERNKDPTIVVCRKSSVTDSRHVREAPQRSKSERTIGRAIDASAETNHAKHTKNRRTIEPAHISHSQARATPALAPIIQTRIPRAFQQVYIASNRGEDLKNLSPHPERQAPRRTRSSSALLRGDAIKSRARDDQVLSKHSVDAEKARTSAPAPIIQTRIPRAFQQVYIASNRGEDLKNLSPHPERQAPRRTRSSSALLRGDAIKSRARDAPAQTKHSVDTEKARTSVPAPIIQTRIPRAFQQLYLAANRGEDLKNLTPFPERQTPRRTKSCLSTALVRASSNKDLSHKPTRSVSFGAVKGITIENIAQDNKNALWFSKDEYSSIRDEVYQIASATHKRGPLKETSKTSSRGLENYIHDDSKTRRVARLSVLEHHDLAMYSLASSRAVQTARQLAEKDAEEAYSIQQESSIN